MYYFFQLISVAQFLVFPLDSKYKIYRSLFSYFCSLKSWNICSMPAENSYHHGGSDAENWGKWEKIGEMDMKDWTSHMVLNVGWGLVIENSKRDKRNSAFD